MEMKKAGAGVASPNRITLLRGIGANGVAASKTTFLEGLNSPFGMALVGNDLYIANADAVLRFPYQTGETQHRRQGREGDGPAGRHQPPLDQEHRRQPGRQAPVRVGRLEQQCRRKRHGQGRRPRRHLGTEPRQRQEPGVRHRPAQSGRHGFNPFNGVLWTSVNERDELGNDLVPDYMTSVKEGAFYGWPYSYYGQHVDTRIKPPRPDLVAKAIAPDYALGAHTASLGLAFYDGTLLPAFKHGALVGQHGSWNRKPHAGYKLVFVPFAAGKPSGPPQDVLTGFLSADGHALGRPVGVAVDKAGAILLADDVGNVVWRVTPAAK